LLEKKSGGKKSKSKLLGMAKREKWSKRHFVVAPGGTTLSYFKNSAAYLAGKEALGSVECEGAVLFRKVNVKDKVYRFTVRTTARELKLRATSEEDYLAWCTYLKDIVRSVGDEEARESMAPRDDDLSDDDDSD